MNPYVAVKHKVKGKFHVGDRARVKYIWPDAIVEIVQDRGPIGYKGSYYYHVRVMRPGLEDITIDWPEDELIPLNAEIEQGRSAGLSQTT